MSQYSFRCLDTNTQQRKKMIINKLLSYRISMTQYKKATYC